MAKAPWLNAEGVHGFPKGMPPWHPDATKLGVPRGRRKKKYLFFRNIEFM